MKLLLLRVSFERVSFTVELEDGLQRPIEVVVGSGASWLRAVLFPHSRTEQRRGMPKGTSLSLDR